MLIGVDEIPDYEFVETSKSKSNRSKHELDLGILMTHKSLTFWIDAYNNKSKTKMYYHYGFSMEKETPQGSRTPQITQG